MLLTREHMQRIINEKASTPFAQRLGGRLLATELAKALRDQALLGEEAHERDRPDIDAPVQGAGRYPQERLVSSRLARERQLLHPLMVRSCEHPGIMGEVPMRKCQRS